MVQCTCCRSEFLRESEHVSAFMGVPHFNPASSEVVLIYCDSQFSVQRSVLLNRRLRRNWRIAACVVPEPNEILNAPEDLEHSLCCSGENRRPLYSVMQEAVDRKQISDLVISSFVMAKLSAIEGTE